MTVQKDLVKNIYVGNSSTKEFPFTFDISKKHPEYVKVYIVDENGIQHESTDFTIDIDSKKITYPKNGEALASNKKIVIIRELPLQQQMNLENNGPYFAEDIEQAFDDAVMVSQQLAEKLSRALTFGVEVDGSEFSTIIPMVPGKSFRVSDDGKSIETTEDPAKVIPIAESLLSQTTQQANIATQQATAAAESALSAADSETNADTAMTQARNSAVLSQKWAESAESPDNQTDTESPTGKTQSSKEWAKMAKTWAEQANILTVNDISAVDKNINLNRKFFDSLARLGLKNATATYEDIVTAMPSHSTLMFYAAAVDSSTSYAPNLNLPTIGGSIIVIKGASNAVPVKFIYVDIAGTNYEFFGQYLQSKGFTGWSAISGIVEQVQGNTTGYIKYSDGRMEQWMRLGNSDIGEGIFNYPVPFKTKCYSFEICDFGTTLTGTMRRFAIESISNTQFQIISTQYSNGNIVENKSVSAYIRFYGWWK